jgi:hypothetical protein
LPQGLLRPADVAQSEGRKIVGLQCGSCHTLDRVTRLNQDREKWNATVRQMVTFGASIQEADITLAVDYLAKNFGPCPATALGSEVERTANKQSKASARPAMRPH